MSLPAADDLFRPTTGGRGNDAETAAPQPEPAAPTNPETSDTKEPVDQPSPPARRGRSQGGRTPSGRVRHDEKMTVYVTAEELLDIEHARLLLRRDHGIAVDRGRLVRAAVAIALAELDSHGDESLIVQRLKQA